MESKDRRLAPRYFLRSLTSKWTDVQSGAQIRGRVKEPEPVWMRREQCDGLREGNGGQD